MTSLTSENALGHKIHDGGAILGPRWERNGRTPLLDACEGEIYTLEQSDHVEGPGSVGIEDMVIVTPDGCAWLTERQRSTRVLQR